MTIQEFCPPSEVDTKSQMTLSPASPDHARVSILLSNGIKILIPIHQSSRVHELHQKALERAAKFGVHAILADTYLQTSGQNEVALCGEDSLEDVWDWTENATFVLRSIQEHLSSSQTVSSLSVQAQPSSDIPGFSMPAELAQVASTASMVFIRLLTLEETISNSRLSSISKDVVAIPSDAPLTQLYSTINLHYQQQLRPSLQREGKEPKAIKTNLYLRECRLDAENNTVSLRDLKLAGSRRSPLDIFVDIDLSDSSVQEISLPKDDMLYNLWGFRTTRRGICTLVTSLEVLIQDIKTRTHALDDFICSLSEATHFPPLMITVKTLCDSHTNYKPGFADTRMLAWSLHLLCLQTAPSWICETPEHALESSRQVISWLCSLRPDPTSSVADERQSLLKSVQIRDKDHKQVEVWRESQDHVFDIELSTVKSKTSGNATRVAVKLDTDDRELASFLSNAIHESSSSSTNYYVNPSTDWPGFFEHEIITPPQPSDFNLLLHSTANSVKFRTIGPDKLAKCNSKDLPVITLSSTGYISIYDQEDYVCGVQRFFTWNATDGKEIMKSGNPGQYLMQKLSTTITERKRTGAWVTDAWSDWTAKAEFGKPDEAVVICMDTSMSMASAMSSSWLDPDPKVAGENLPSRLTEVKEFFKNLASRVSALQLSTYLGLVTFSNRECITVRQELTPVHLDFEDQMEEILPMGQTAIFDGIEKARQMLNTLKEEYKDVKCRIVILTDGQDNQSISKPVDVSKGLYSDNIVLDSIVIGTGATWSRQLFKISRNTGGYAFAPKDQRTFFQIFLLETMVDLRTRPDARRETFEDWVHFTPKADDMADTYHFPPSRPHPNESDDFIALKDAERYLTRLKSTPVDKAQSVLSSTTKTTSTAFTGTTISGGGGASRMILAEIREIINNPHPYMDVYISESNMGFWLVAMQGPPDSPYSQGTFKLYLELGPEFPLRPPSARFMTPMLHPNITKHGRICHPILDREWTGTTRIYQVLQHIWGILVSLEARDAVDPLSALKLWTDPVQGRLEVERYVKHFASKSRAAIRVDLYHGKPSKISSAASVSSDSTVTDGKNMMTPTSSVVSSAPPSYRSRESAPTQRPALFRSLLALRSNRPATAPAPPLMVISDQNAATEGQDNQSETSSVTSSQKPTKKRRRSLFGGSR